MKQKIILVILLILFPISPWIWKAIVVNDEQQSAKLIQNHLFVMIAIWILIAFIFGFYGGKLIETLSAFY